MGVSTGTEPKEVLIQIIYLKIHSTHFLHTCVHVHVEVQHWQMLNIFLDCSPLYSLKLSHSLNPKYDSSG